MRIVKQIENIYCFHHYSISKTIIISSNLFEMWIQYEGIHLKHVMRCFLLISILWSQMHHLCCWFGGVISLHFTGWFLFLSHFITINKNNNNSLINSYHNLQYNLAASFPHSFIMPKNRLHLVLPFKDFQKYLPCTQPPFRIPDNFFVLFFHQCVADCCPDVLLSTLHNVIF